MSAKQKTKNIPTHRAGLQSDSEGLNSIPDGSSKSCFSDRRSSGSRRTDTEKCDAEIKKMEESKTKENEIALKRTQNSIRDAPVRIPTTKSSNDSGRGMSWKPNPISTTANDSSTQVGQNLGLRFVRTGLRSTPSHKALSTSDRETVKKSFSSVESDKASAGSESSDEPSPVRLSPVKRFEDFPNDEARAKYFSARNENLDIVRKRMMIIRGKRRRKAEREQKKKMEVRKSLEASRGHGSAGVLSSKHHEATSIPLRSSSRRNQNDELGCRSSERLFDVRKRLNFDDDILPTMKPSNSRALKLEKERPVINYYEPDSRYRPRYEPCKPLTMKGRSKDVRDANILASFGLVKLGGDSAHVTALRGLPNIRRGKITMANYIRHQQMRENDKFNHRLEDSGETLNDRLKTKRKRDDVEMQESGGNDDSHDCQDAGDIQPTPRKRRRHH